MLLLPLVVAVQVVVIVLLAWVVAVGGHGQRLELWQVCLLRCLLCLLAACRLLLLDRRLIIRVGGRVRR